MGLFIKRLSKTVMLTATLGLALPVLPTTVFAATIPELATQTEIGNSKINLTTPGQMEKAFITGGDSTPFKNGQADLTQGLEQQFGSASFKYSIDVSQPFKFKGVLRTSTGGNSARKRTGDAFGVMMAPVAPEKMGNGSRGGLMGIGKDPAKGTGFSDAHFWGIDFHYNSEQNDAKVSWGTVNNRSQYASFRSTDNQGMLRPYDGSVDKAQEIGLNRNGDDVEINWTPKQVSGDQVTGTLNSAAFKDVWGRAKTWSKTITVYRNMGFGVIAATGQDTSTMTVDMRSFELQLGTSNVTFKGVPAAGTIDTSDFKAPVFTPAVKPALVGAHVTVLRDETAQADAAKDPNYDPDYVYLAPKVPGYELAGKNHANYLNFTIGNDVNTECDLTYEKTSDVTVKYQYAASRGQYFKQVTKSGYDGETYAIDSPQQAGFTPDIKTVTGKFGDKKAVVVTYYPIYNRPLNPFDPKLDDPVTPVNPGDGSDVPTDASGQLTLDYAATFDFGKQKISALNQTYHATAQTFSDANHAGLITPLYAQVTDLREQPGKWALQVKLGELKSQSSNTTLAQAYLEFKGAALASTDANQKGVTAMADQSAFFGDTIQIMSADNVGVWGTWLTRFGGQNDFGTDYDGRKTNSGVSLVVPGTTAKAEAYQANMNWMLMNVPGTIK
ncbi:WxL domain-containing protein [Weissella confusa]|uniref:WxL domain-containing protein n=1 Tax=Weissella fermenti TaxID=2987699 RepID=A0ABT6D212_9LACO|nr:MULTISPECIES: WxL domain-containing protein [Weissella]MBJ7689208.1 WxL domain-containing protein [Weissella confusa]MCW0927095.1 WxL domain-containing protein [Weissella sp. LMG 11983]MDF9299533.1 WxL domain-containing protein [Weissella sp. BK2]